MDTVSSQQLAAGVQNDHDPWVLVQLQPYWTINLKLIYFTFKTRLFWPFLGKTKIRLNHQQSAAGGEGSMALHGQQFWVTHSLCPSKKMNLFMDLMAPTCWKNSVFETWGLKFKQQYVTYLSYTSSGGHHATITSMTLRELHPAQL